MTLPKVTIVGTGGSGRAYAATLQHQGRFRPVLFSPTGNGLRAKCSLRATGLVDATMDIDVAANWAEAVDSAQVIIVAIAANGYKPVLSALATHLQAGQTVLISAQLSFASLYLKLALGAGPAVYIGAFPTTPITGNRRDGPGVHIGSKRSEIDVAALDPSHGPRVLETCESMFGPHFNLLPRMIGIELSNLNPEIHAANMILNFTRAEKGEEWSNYGCQTRGVINIVKGTSRERMALAESFGLQVRSAEDHYHRSFDLEYDHLHVMASRLALKRSELKGPTTTQTRFLYEDQPYGVYPIIALAKARGVPTPHYEALALLLSTACEVDFCSTNELASDLDFTSWGDESIDSDLKSALSLYGVL